MAKVYVTGMGIITALGDTLELNRDGLMQGKCAIGKLDSFPSKYAETLLFGEIKHSNAQLKKMLNVNVKGVSRTSLLALHAFNQAIQDAGISEKELSNSDTSLVIANTVGGMCLTDELYQDANQHNSGSEYIASYDCGSVGVFLQDRFKIRGIVNTINTACSSSANAIMYGARLIKKGYAKRVIVGGTDSLAKFTINGFNSLHILSPGLCAPFDKDRSGLNLGEGAAFLVLEGEDSIVDQKIIAEVKGYANANDAYHPSTLSENGDGPFLAMQQALKQAGLTPGDIDFINTHGTGTENNDEVEGRAMIRLFNKVPAFTSTKSNIGHTLGASGAIEAVYCILNLLHQEIYPSLNFKESITDTRLIPEQSYSKTVINNVMSNSFGFGGNCSSVILSKV
ncbi:MAG: beta-ketoacyl-[acyl-carrier-protein] synthase family protein [Bacteroidota bacterium]